MPSKPLRRYQHVPNPWALVTGSTNGMGEEWAHQLASQGFNLILHGRSHQKLERVKSEILAKTSSSSSSSSSSSGFTPEIRFLISDASSHHQPDGEFESSLQELLSDPRVKLTVAINNLGVVLKGYPLLEEVTSEQISQLIVANATFPCVLSSKLLPHLKANQPSLLVNVSSLGAWAPSPYLSIYSASKSFNLVFSHSLYNEMKVENCNVDVVAMVPGTVVSGMNQGPPTSMMPTSKDWVQSAIRSLSPSIFSSRPPPTIIPWSPHSMASKFLNLLPTTLAWNMVRKVNVEEKKKYLASSSSSSSSNRVGEISSASQDEEKKSKNKEPSEDGWQTQPSATDSGGGGGSLSSTICSTTNTR
ncbi:NAD(P)-binding protein [Violaceomyces palustris]|uniref:NAD(P)-binding protein n=1 Tax=Violaceomyces palustris TaxID=1673888 RepID=A0ACD0P7N9_9BASI|nr:NAD(P)-binding protein [Violaceomyces palustris]